MVGPLVACQSPRKTVLAGAAPTAARKASRFPVAAARMACWVAVAEVWETQVVGDVGEGPLLELIEDLGGIDRD